MSTFKVNSFSSWDEWSIVRDGLFSTSRDDQRKALAIVQAWKCRGGIPSSVESTAQIVDSILRDTSSSHRASAEEIQLLYSIVIIRAVNLIVEPNQQGFYADSVLNLAVQAGIPGWIVELRHEATHKHQPSLSLLRTAAQFLLRWFQEHYWDPQYEFLRINTLICMECSHKSKNQKRALREAPSKIRKIESFAKDIAIPVIITHWDAEISRIFHEYQQGSIKQNSLVIVSIASSLNLFDQWADTLRIIQYPTEGNMPISLPPDQFLIPILSHILSLLDSTIKDELLPIRLSFSYVWIHRLLRCFYENVIDTSKSICVVDLIKRNFIRTALYSKHVELRIKSSQVLCLEYREELLQQLSSMIYIIECYTNNNMENLQSVLSEFDIFLKDNDINSGKSIGKPSEKDNLGNANISAKVGSGSYLDSMEKWLATVKSNQPTSGVLMDNDQVERGNSQISSKRKKYSHERFDGNSCIPMWPLGLAPGRVNCIDLLTVQLDQE